jgi:prepilin-type N-terminal cleavage/methylation domain-containing protein
MNTKRAAGFTLIELIIVIGLLGALAAVMLPSLTVKRVESLQQIVDHDMAEIRHSFQRLYEDVVFQAGDLEGVRRYGLYPLMARPESFYGWTIPEYDAERSRGWRGPYAQQEGQRTVSSTSTGQALDAAGVEVPVIEDPFSSTGTDGHYYRVAAPPQQGGGYVFREMLLIFIGANGSLDISLPTLAAGEVLDLSALTAGTDDAAIRLCPYVE